MLSKKTPGKPSLLKRLTSRAPTSEAPHSSIKQQISPLDCLNSTKFNLFDLATRSIADGVTLNIPLLQKLSKTTQAYIFFQLLNLDENSSWAMAAICGDIAWLLEKKYLTQPGVLTFLAFGGQLEIIKHFFADALSEHRGQEHNHRLNLIAAQSGFFEICDHLKIVYGESPYFVMAGEDDTVVHCYAQYGDLARLKTAVIAKPEFSKKFEHGSDLLFSAVRGGDVETVRLIVGKDKDIVAHPTKQLFETCFHVAAQYGHVQLLKLFTEEFHVLPPKKLALAGIDSPLTQTGISGSWECFTLLYPLYQKLPDLKKCLAKIAMLAVANNHMDFFEKIIAKHGKDLLKITDDYGLKLSHYVISSQNFYTIRKMISEYKVDFTEQNTNGEIALLYFAKNSPARHYGATWKFLAALLSELNTHCQSSLHLIADKKGNTFVKAIDDAGEKAHFPNLFQVHENNETVVLFNKACRDVQFSIATKLSRSDWLTMHRVSKRMHQIYSSDHFWHWALRNFDLLNNYTLEHSAFTAYPFNPERLMKILITAENALSKKQRNGIEPWQLAALNGLVVPLSETYGKEVTSIEDEAGFCIIDYLTLGGNSAAVFEWREKHQPTFMAQDDPQRLLPKMAVRGGHIGLLIKLCAELGYDLKEYDAKAQRTLLHEAVEYNQFAMLQWLLFKGVSADLGENLASLALQGDQWDIFVYLEKYKIVPVKDDAITTAYHAIKHSQFPRALQMIKNYSIDAGSVRGTNLSFFKAATLSGNCTTVENALIAGWGALSDTDSIGATAFHFCAENGFIQLIHDIISIHPNELSITKLDDEGNSVLHSAAKFGNWKKLIELLAKYFKPEDLGATNTKGHNVAHIAAMNHQLNFLYMLAKQPNELMFNAKDLDGNTILHLAVEAAGAKTAIWLIKNMHFSLTAVNNFQQTPLHLLALKGQNYAFVWRSFQLIAKELDDVCVLTDYKNNSGQTVQDLMLLANKGRLFEEIKQNLQHKTASLQRTM